MALKPHTTTTPDLLVMGASARAAVQSALRAGLSPWWIDQFGDTDLRDTCPGEMVPAGQYPAGLVALAVRAPRAPYIYTGALENHGAVLEALSAARPLLGNDAATCARARDPLQLSEVLAAHGIPFPETRAGNLAAPDGGWLHKPLRSGGGLGITTAVPGIRCARNHVLQRRVDGESRAALFVADGRNARLLGVTRQLVGEPWLHAGHFSYCGSLGPLRLDDGEGRAWQRIGDVLAMHVGLRGLFGVDAVMADGAPVIIEVNPRYTASVEVVEAGIGPVMGLHVAACGGTLPEVTPPAPAAVHGKAILFAPSVLEIRRAPVAPVVEGRALRIADVPATGTRIGAGAPVLTLLASAADEGACARLLREGTLRIQDALS